MLLRFSKTQILKFKSQVTFAFFTAVNHLSRPLRKQMFNFKGFQRSWFVIFDWWTLMPFVCFCVLGFIACDHYYDCGSKKCNNCEGGF